MKVAIQQTTLRAGSLAYIDTTFSGLIPCRVIKIVDTSDPTPRPIRFELTEGGISSCYRALVEITEDGRGYHKGEQLDQFAHDVIPRVCVLQRAYSTVIKAYRVEVSQ